MGRSKINYIIDMLMAAFFFITAITGLILFLFLNEGRRGGKGFFGIARHALVDMHNWSGAILIALIIAHLILHWGWIVRMTKDILFGNGGAPVGGRDQS